LVFKTKRKIAGVDPRSGKELWQFPFRPSQDNTIVTPLIVENRLMTSDYEFGIGAWQIRSSAGAWNVQPLWKTSDVSLFMSSPVLAGGLVVGFSHYRKGQLFVLDPADGRVLWRGDPRSGEHATLISWENRLLLFREDGWLEIGEVSRTGFKAERKFRLGDSICWAHPVLVGNRILVRDGTRLIAYQLTGR
jgi:outer membrane protein assembly factor BamB